MNAGSVTRTSPGELRGKRILIAGCGAVGGRLAGRLAAAGAEVIALRRGAAAPGPRVETLRADLRRRGALDGLALPIDAVVFSAAPDSPDEAGYRALFLEGLGNLIATLETHARPPQRLIFTSSTAVYGQSSGEWVDEASPTRPTRFNGAVLLEAESLVHGAAFPGCALRLGGLYGPGRMRQVDAVRAGRARLAPGPPHFTNRIHLDDAAGSLFHLLALPAVEPLYLGVDCEPADGNEVLCFLASRLGLPEPPMAADEPPRRSGSKRCRNDRLLASGYRFVYPSWRDGYGAALA